MQNFWLKKKEMVIKSVDVKSHVTTESAFTYGKLDVFVELSCGRKWICNTIIESDGRAILNTMCASYDDPRFYALEWRSCPSMKTGGYHSAIDVEPWNEDIHEARLKVVCKAALEVLYMYGELSREYVEDMKDDYDLCIS